MGRAGGGSRRRRRTRREPSIVFPKGAWFKLRKYGVGICNIGSIRINK